jgi:hypothetical protein
MRNGADCCIAPTRSPVPPERPASILTGVLLRCTWRTHMNKDKGRTGTAMRFGSIKCFSSRLDVPAVFEYFSIVRYNENGKDICAIHVQPSEQPVFLGKDFYMRVGNKNQPLSGHDLLAYVASRWSWLGSRLQHKQSPSSPPPA